MMIERIAGFIVGALIGSAIALLYIHFVVRRRKRSPWNQP